MLSKGENAAEVVRIATAAAFGKWRDDRKIFLTKTKRLVVESSKEIPATLDGESVNLGTRAQIDLSPEYSRFLCLANNCETLCGNLHGFRS